MTNQKIKIKRVGSYFYLDKNGFVIGIDTKIPIQPAWEKLIEKTVQFYQDSLKKNLHSIYIRGSVAKGEAISYLSDLDSFAVVYEDADLNFDEVPFHDEMKSEFPFCDHLELVAISLDKVREVPPKRERSIWEELIKTQSRCVWGEDLAQTIKPFSLAQMKGHSLYIKKEVEEKLPQYLEEDKDIPEDLKANCSWIMRRLIRGCFDLVMEKEQKFTRDLYLCYESVIKHYPEVDDKLHRALDLSLNPSEDYPSWMPLVNELKDFIIYQMRNTH